MSESLCLLFLSKLKFSGSLLRKPQSISINIDVIHGVFLSDLLAQIQVLLVFFSGPFLYWVILGVFYHFKLVGAVEEFLQLLVRGLL